MQSKKNQCEEKMSFDTKLEADNTAIVTDFQRGTKLKTYKCRDCGLWHLSSNFGEKYDD